jgi:hypothetical protein
VLLSNPNAPQPVGAKRSLEESPQPDFRLGSIAFVPKGEAVQNLPAALMIGE